MTLVFHAEHFFGVERLMRGMRLSACLLSFFIFSLATNSVAQEAVSEISFRGDSWSISQLPLYDRPSSETYLILPIILRTSGKWEIGGSVNQDGYEQIFVDLAKRQIGPNARNTDRSGKFYDCKGSKTNIRKKWRSQGLYGACRSHFFSADGVAKAAQAIIACAILACVGGYDSDWFPMFRAAR